jgi:hypothetical protein
MTALAVGLLALSVLTLCWADLQKHPRLALCLALFAAAMGSLAVAHRTVHEEDDVLNYLDLYLALGRGDWTMVSDLGGGLEFGLPLLLRAMHVLLGPLSIPAFLFWLTFVVTASVVFVYAWIIPKATGNEHFGLKLAFSVAFISFFAASHTSRQFLADVSPLPLLFLPTSTGRSLRITLISDILHSTSVLYVVLMQICRSWWSLVLLLAGVTWAALRWDSALDLMALAIPSSMQGKFTLLTLQDFANEDISNVPDLLRLGMMSGLVFVAHRIWPDGLSAPTRRFIYLGFLTFALLVDVPFIGNRLNHMLLNVAFGLIILACLRQSVGSMRVAVLVGLAYQCRLLLQY